MLKPDSTRYSSVVQTHGVGPEWTEPDPAEFGPESGEVVAFPKAELPTDLALDLRLREILQQARLATAAGGAVIALARGDKMVCRVTLGEKAPSAGVRLNTRSGLSGACIQTREMQLCDDTLADSRVNVVACRDLGIRSIVVLPVLEGGELWGVLELFSSMPRAFNESELQALQSLSRKISSTVHEAIEGGSTVVGVEPFLQKPVADLAAPETVDSHFPFAPIPGPGDIPQRDYRTGTLTAAVLALAVLLGWMVGRVGWSMAVNRAPAQLSAVSEEEPATPKATPTIQPPPQRHEEPPTSTTVAAPPFPVPVQAKPSLKPKPPTAAPVELNGGLVVYEHGKVVFQMASQEKENADRKEPGVPASGAVQEASARTNDGSTVPASTDAPSENAYLLHRVEPKYPEAARQQHIQGPVLLDVLVGTNGLVREATVISGDVQLAKAAIDAVRQWRFNPHQLEGKAAEFETRITVNFALPEN